MKLTNDELNGMVEAMGDLNSGSFELTAPDGYESDEPDSLGDLETNDSIEINIEDSRDLFEELEGELALCEYELRMEDYNREDAAAEDFYYEDDGQPTEYEEWQDVNGGDDWDHGQYDEC